MKDFNQVQKLLLCNLEELDEQLSQITNDKDPLIYSGNYKTKEQENIRMTDLDKIKDWGFNKLSEFGAGFWLHGSVNKNRSITSYVTVLLVLM